MATERIRGDGGDSTDSENNDEVPPSVEEFLAGLTPEEINLVRLRDELYERSWERMRADLQHRLTGRPYIFKLVNRIEDDLARIKRLQAFEERHGIDLGPLLERK